MTEREAISWLRTTMSCAEELCEYEIEAFEVAEKALEKQIPKKPEHYDDTEYFYIECPTCNKRFGSRFKYKDCTQRCPYCSQAVSLYGESEVNENETD